MDTERKQTKALGFFWSLVLAMVVFLLVLLALLAFMPASENIAQILKDAVRITALSILILCAANIINYIIKARIRELAKLSGAEFDETRVLIAQHIISAILYLVAFVFILKLIPGLADVAFSLLAGAGIVAIIIGFAAKDVASNLIAGLFIAIFRPFRVGDRILFKDIRGTVEEITMRHTVIRTWDNQRLVVPNAMLTESIIVNYSLKDEKCVESIEIPISYEADIDKAKRIMEEEIKKHPSYIEPKSGSEYLTKQEPIKIRVTEISDSAIILKAYFWAKNKPAGFRMAADLRESIKKRFDAEGIEIPYPHRTIVYKNKKQDR